MSEPRAFAVCAGCGAAIEGWRERITPVPHGELVRTERGELAIRVQDRGACPVCGHDVVEIRVEEPR
jgi:hypothetical protein